MAKGNAIADYTLKITSTTYSAGPAGSTLIQSNVDGPVTAGFGTAAAPPPLSAERAVRSVIAA